MKKPVFIALFLSVNIAFSQVGTIKWTFSADDAINTCPAIADDGTIYVTAADGYLYALNSDGSQKWNFKAGFNGGEDRTWINNSPVIGSNGTIYIVEDYGTVYAINADGTEIWHVDVTPNDESVVDATPSLSADGTLVIQTRDGSVIALNASNGEQKWKVTGSAGSTQIYSSPAIDANGTVITGAALQSFKADGTLNWSSANGSSQSSPAIGADGTIYIGSANDKCLYAVNGDGSDKWTFKTGDNVYSSPLVGSDNTIYIFAVSKLYAVKPDGTKKWEFTDIAAGFNSILLTPVLGTDNILYFGCVTSAFAPKMFALNTEDGSVIWSENLSDLPSNFSTITEDSLLLFSISDDLYAMKVASAGLAKAPWPKYKNDAKNTGYTSAVVTAIEQINTTAPMQYALSDAYPNPFNPLTHFRFTLPKSSRVNITVYNVLGQAVDNLFNETKNSGTYEVTWNASSFGSGVYFIRFNAGDNFSQIKKVILVK